MKTARECRTISANATIPSSLGVRRRARMTKTTVVSARVIHLSSNAQKAAFPDLTFKDAGVTCCDETLFVVAAVSADAADPSAGSALISLFVE
jgi:hypothetical protein